LVIHSSNKRRKILLTAVPLLLFGALISVWVFTHARNNLKAELIQDAQNITLGLSADDLGGLQDADSDPFPIQAIRLEKRLEWIHNIYPSADVLNLFGRNADGDIFLIAQFLSPNPEEEPYTERLQTEVTESHIQVFVEAQSVLNTITDPDGIERISILAPVMDTNSSEVRAVFEMVVDGSDLDQRLYPSVLLPVIFTAAAAVVIAAGWGLIKFREQNETGSARQVGLLCTTVGFILTILAVWVAYHIEDRRQLQYFENAADQRAVSISESLRNFRTGAMESFRSYYESSEEVSESDFKQFSTHSLEQPLVEAWAWAPVTSSETPGDELLNEITGDPEIDPPDSQLVFQGNEVLADGAGIDPILHASPAAYESELIGLDLASIPEIHEALETALSYRGVVAADPAADAISLVLDNRLLVFCAVHQPDGQLQGFLMAVLKPEVLVQEYSGTEDIVLMSLTRWGPGQHPVFQGYNDPDSGVLFHSNVLQFRTTYPLFEFGSGFVLTAVPGPGMEFSWAALVIVMLSGLALSAAFGRILESELTKRQNLQRMASEKAAALTNNEIFTESILQSIADGVISVDQTGTVLQVNTTSTLLTGYHQADAVGQPLDKVLKLYSSGQDSRGWESVLETVIEQARTLDLSSDTVILTHDKVMLQVYGSISPIHSIDGVISGAVIIFRPVSEEYMRLEDLRTSEQQFRSMFTDHSAVMLLLDPESGKILRANSAAEAYYGYSQGDFASLTIYELNVKSSALVRPSLKKAVQKEESRFFVEHRLSSGEVRGVEINSAPVIFEGRVALFEIIQDVTDRNQMESDLLKKTADMEYLVQAAEELTTKKSVIMSGNYPVRIMLC